MPLAYLDGKFVDKAQVTISPLDYGFARGVTVFEYTRLYGSVPFRLAEHIQRFSRGADVLGIPVPASPKEIIEAVKKIATSNAYAHSGMKFYLTIGECGKPGSFGFKTCADFKPHFMIIEEEAHPVHPEAPRGLPLYQRGIALKTAPFARQIPEVKTINYAPGFVASRQLAGTDYDEILFLHPNGHVTETPTSNFFCVIDGALCTPGQDMLGGVTRTVMLELAEKLGIPTDTKNITLADLRRASEAFITGTFLEMLPVRMIDDISYTATMDAPVFAKLRKTFTTCIVDACKANC